MELPIQDGAEVTVATYPHTYDLENTVGWTPSFCFLKTYFEPQSPNFHVPLNVVQSTPNLYWPFDEIDTRSRPSLSSLRCVRSSNR